MSSLLKGNCHFAAKHAGRRLERSWKDVMSDMFCFKDFAETFSDFPANFGQCILSWAEPLGGGTQHVSAPVHGVCPRPGRHHKTQECHICHGMSHRNRKGRLFKGSKATRTSSALVIFAHLFLSLCKGQFQGFMPGEIATNGNLELTQLTLTHLTRASCVGSTSQWRQLW